MCMLLELKIYDVKIPVIFIRETKKQQTQAIFSSKLEMIIEKWIKIYKLYNSLVTFQIATTTIKKFHFANLDNFLVKTTIDISKMQECLIHS